MLRIHFTLADLARTRVVAEPDVTWEIVLILQLLQNTAGRLAFDRWLHRPRGVLDQSARLLLAWGSHVPDFPDFLTSAVGAAVLYKSLGLLAGQPHLPAWLRRMADGNQVTPDQVGDAFRRYHASVIQPAWSSIRAHVQTDRERRINAFADGDCEAMLNSFRPLLRWVPPALEVDCPVQRDLRLATPSTCSTTRSPSCSATVAPSRSWSGALLHTARGEVLH